MKAKEFVPASKPRNFVAKNQKTAGAGAHKDKKKAEKQGNVKHKAKQYTEDAEPMDREFHLVKKLGRLGERIVQNPKLWDKYSEVVESDDPDWIISLIQDGTGATFDEVLKLSDLFGEIGGGMGRIIDFAWAVKEGNWEKDFLNPYRKHRSQGVAEGAESTVSSLDAVFNEHDFDRLEHIWPALEDGDKEEALRQINHYLRKGKTRAWWGDLQALDIKIDSSDVENSQVMWSKPINQEMEERVRDPEDWDEGNTEPGNNFAIYINGKKWKVLPGPSGAYADSPEERREYQRLKDMAQRKSQQTGKKWEVHITGEAPT